jgi:hypothetical protein
MADLKRAYKEDYDRMRHSGFGIVSFVISILVGVTLGN